MSPPKVKNCLILKKLEWEHKQKIKNVESDFKDQMQDYLAARLLCYKILSNLCCCIQSLFCQREVQTTVSAFLSLDFKARLLFVGNNFLTLFLV